MSSENGSTMFTRTFGRRRADYATDQDSNCDSVKSPSPPSATHLHTHGMTSKISSSPLPGRGQLAQEIQNEFLICKICLDIYKTPKCLSCLHTFCEQCIENHVNSEMTYKKFSDYRDFTCPLCRKRTQLPLGGVRKLPDNFLVSSLSEMLARQSGEEERVVCCDICKIGGSPAPSSPSQLSATTSSTMKRIAAKHRCLDCNKHLCGDCLRLHRGTRVTKDHSIIDVEIAAKVICKQHADEVVHFFCEQCQTCICVLCTFHDHRDHEISNFTEAVVRHKEELIDLMTECKSKISLYEDNIDRVLRTDNVIREAQQKIRDISKMLIEEIRQQEHQLLDEIDSIYGQHTFDILQQCTDWQVQLEALCSTCGMAEMVLQGRDIELLLLKNDIEIKLRSLSKGAEQNLPEAIHRQIAFLPGHVELGFIDVTDASPEDKRTSAYKKVVQQDSTSCQTDDYDVSSVVVSVQTEPRLVCDSGCETESPLRLDQSVGTSNCDWNQEKDQSPPIIMMDQESLFDCMNSAESGSVSEETEYCSD